MNPRLLVLTPRLPFPLYGGDLLRIYRLCESLNGHFRITLLSICQTRTEMEVELPNDNPFSEVHRIFLPKWHSYLNALSALVMGRSMQLAYYSSSEFARAVAQLQKEHDVLLCHLARTAQYAFLFSKTKVLELTDYLPLTYARSNALRGKAVSLRRMIYTLEQARVDRAQNSLASQFNLITFVSDVDRAMFLKSSGIPDSRVATFGNGVNLDERPFRQDRSGKTLAFIGTLRAMPNSDAVAHFVTSVLPIIHRSEPAAKVRVVGAVDGKFRARFEGTHVQFTGAVPDLAHAVQDCVLGICPVRIGAGVQNKLLDYLALGLPAVTTRIGAEGLSGAPFLLADSPEEFASSIVSLLKDEDRRRDLAHRGRVAVERDYTWSSRLAGLPSRILQSESDC